MLTASERRRIYQHWIEDGLSCFTKIHSQDAGSRSGCFFPPYRNRSSNYSNARWQEIVQAGLLAPTASNRQHWRIVAITEPETIKNCCRLFFCNEND